MNDGMGAWPLPSYDREARERELGLSPRREATPWFKNSHSRLKDAPQEQKGFQFGAEPQRPPRESVQAWLERTAREGKPEYISQERAMALFAGDWIDGSVLPTERGIYETYLKVSGYADERSYGTPFDGKWCHCSYLLGGKPQTRSYGQPLTGVIVLRYRRIPGETYTPLTIAAEDLPDVGSELKTICGMPAEQWVSEGWVKWEGSSTGPLSVKEVMTRCGERHPWVWVNRWWLAGSPDASYSFAESSHDIIAYR